MSTPFFRFKQFTVWHDRCAMKVGTDGVLLGAWAAPREDVENVSDAESISCPLRILDVGTGSGLVALMLAQRFPCAQVDAIDIDEAATEQAANNFGRSPFAERLRAQRCSLQEWTSEKYDLIASNPPYFSHSLQCPDASRTSARHNDSLGFGELIAHADRLLAPAGVITLVLPIEAEEGIKAEARLRRLYCTRLTYVHTKVGKPAKRILTAFSRGEPPTPPVAEHLCLSEDGTTRSAAYQKLTEAFYL
ncbi:MAG: tRNA1(Val) (adenine(37)-N6)-methyltransferase [Paludibacteraceae bacterium]